MTGETPAKRLLGDGAWDGRGGGMLPSLRPHYHPDTAKALHALAESNPTPRQYREAKERILARSRR